MPVLSAARSEVRRSRTSSVGPRHDGSRRWRPGRIACAPFALGGLEQVFRDQRVVGALDDDPVALGVVPYGRSELFRQAFLPYPVSILGEFEKLAHRPLVEDGIADVVLVQED